MTTITRVTTRLLPVRNKALSTSYASAWTPERTHLFVRLEAKGGIAGIAEGSPLPHFSGEYATAMAQVIDEKLGPALIGQDIFALEALQQALERTTSGHYSSKSVLMNAVLDAQGRHTGLPVSRLLGGPLHTRVPLAGAVGLGDISGIMSTLREYHAAGIRTFKLKIGGDVRRDIATISAVRSEFGMEVELRADANGAFSRADARRFLELVRPYDLQYLEQPLPAADLSGLAGLRQISPVPIAVDESLYSLSDAVEIIRQNSADVFIIKLIKLGGLHVARKVVAVAEGAGIACVAVSPYETVLGASANLHLACSSTAFPWALEIGAGPTAIDLPGVAPFMLKDGQVTLPHQPGLGIDVPPDFFGSDMLLSKGPHG